MNPSSKELPTAVRVIMKIVGVFMMTVVPIKGAVVIDGNRC